MSKASEYYLSGGVSGRLKQFETNANNTSASSVGVHRGMLQLCLGCTLTNCIVSGKKYQVVDKKLICFCCIAKYCS
jgi:hypothetical protein